MLVSFFGRGNSQIMTSRMDALWSSNGTVVTSRRKYPPNLLPGVCRLLGSLGSWQEPTIVSHTSTTLLLKNQIHLWALISFSVFGHLRCACTHWQCCPLLQQSKARHPCWDPSILPSVDFNLSPCHPIPKHMKSKKLSDCTFYFYLSEWYIWLYRQGESIILRLYVK